MLHNNKIVSLFLAGSVWLLLSGCYKNMSVISDTGEEISRTVSFNTELIPMFNASCNMSGCHNSGGKSPDLSPASAYVSLINGSYVNTDNPEASELYLWMTGKKGTPMPVSGINKDYNSLVLAWIKQGAQNN